MAEVSAAPLQGLRVVDFGHVWAGPYCTATLADMGAEVIKVESLQRLDIHRRQGPYPGQGSGHNRSGVWNAQNRGKRSVTLNLSTLEGRELARRLVVCSDVVVENFTPGVMSRLGLDYNTLRALKPDLVMASLFAFGQDGPQGNYVGYGPSLDAWSGLCSLTAYPDGPPMALGGIFPDTASALHAAFAILAALHHRDKTGEGVYIDLSELEVSGLLLADLLVDYLGDGSLAQPLGNADAYHVPQGCYPCQGEDRWLALSVPDELAWLGLCSVLGRPEWGTDPDLRTAAGRKARLAEIEAAITDWTEIQDSLEAFHRLQAVGVPAGMAQDVPGLLEDAQLRARGFFQTVAHPEVGDMLVYGPIWRWENAPGDICGPAPMLGQDNDYVLGEILGLDPEEIRRLTDAHVVY